jgi:selT/selW/selH-like putative selenoprotein
VFVFSFQQMMNRNWAIFFACLAVLSIKDAFINGQHGHGHKHGDNSAEDFSEFDDTNEPGAHKYTKEANEGFGDNEGEEDVEIRDPSGYADTGKPFTVPLNSPPVKFSYCVSCGYRQAFDQFTQIINEKFPGMVISGENFPPAAPKAILAQVLSITKMALIVSIIFNRNPFDIIGIQTPGFYNWMTQNKVSACMMLFMFSNSLEGMLMSTGAFEIYLGEELIWSKLESGRVPSPVELIQAIESHLQLGGAKLGSDTFGIDSD